jgi:hypothetical protein
MTLRYFDTRRLLMKWEVVRYVDESASDAQLAALAEIYLASSGSRVMRFRGRLSATFMPFAALASQSSTSHHASASTLSVRDTGGRRRGLGTRATCAVTSPDSMIPAPRSTSGLSSADPLLRFEGRGKRHAAFATDVDHRSDASTIRRR